MKVAGTPYEVVLIGNGGYAIVQNTRVAGDGIYTLVPVAPERFATRTEANRRAQQLAKKA